MKQGLQEQIDQINRRLEEGDARMTDTERTVAANTAVLSQCVESIGVIRAGQETLEDGQKTIVQNTGAIVTLFNNAQAAFTFAEQVSKVVKVFAPIVVFIGGAWYAMKTQLWGWWK